MADSAAISGAIRILHCVGREAVVICRPHIAHLDGVLLLPQRRARIFAIHAEILGGVGHRLDDLVRTERKAGWSHAHDTVNLGTAALHVGQVGPDIPGIGRRPPIFHRRRIAANADIGRRPEAISRRHHRGGGICPARATGRKRLEASPGPEPGGLRAGAVEMGRLVPTEVEVLLAGLGKVEVIILIFIADILAAEIDLVEAIPASGSQREIGERSRPDVAVFVVFGQALLVGERDRGDGQIFVGVNRRLAVALRVVEEIASADFNEATEPPIGHGIGLNRRLQRDVRGGCHLSQRDGQNPSPAAQHRTDQACPRQSDSPLHCRPLKPILATLLF